MIRERQGVVFVRHPMDQPLSHRSPAARVSHIDAFDTLAAWRPPEPRPPRFGAANDPALEAAEADESIIDWKWGDPISPNAIAIGGALFFALLGALFGNAFQL